MANQAFKERLHTPYMRELTAADKIIVKRYIEKARGNESEASRAMGINRTTLRKKLELYGLNK